MLIQRAIDAVMADAAKSESDTTKRLRPKCLGQCECGRNRLASDVAAGPADSCVALACRRCGRMDLFDAERLTEFLASGGTAGGDSDERLPE